MPRAAVLVLVLAAVLLASSGCGAGSKPKKEILRSVNPLTSDLYVQVRGPAGAVNYIADAIATGAFTHAGSGSFVPPRLHRRLHEQRACLFAHTIGSADSPKLQPWLGRKLTISVSGNKSNAALYCRAIAVVFLGAS